MTVLTLHLYRQVMRRGRVIGLTALVATLGLILWITSLGGGTGSSEVFHSTLIAGGTIFSLAMLIVTVAVLRDEKDGGTLPFILLRPIPRPQFAAAALLAGILSGLTMAAITWALTTLGAWAGGIPLDNALAALVLYSSAAIGYAAVFVPLGFMVPRALLIGLMYVVLVEGVISQILASVAQLSIWRIASSLYAGVADDIPEWIVNTYISPLTPGSGWFKLVGVVVAGWAVLLWAVKNSDAG